VNPIYDVTLVGQYRIAKVSRNNSESMVGKGVFRAPIPLVKETARDFPSYNRELLRVCPQ
jgi:hypothetical protein